MKAIQLTRYGNPDVLQMMDTPRPTPADNEVLIKIRATSVTYGDLSARNFKAITPAEFNMPLPIWLLAKLSFGLNEPQMKTLGSEFSGEIEAVGKDVTAWKTGDQVFGYRGQAMGAYAEYLCVPQDGVLAAKPANMSFEQAAVAPYGAIMALNLLRKMEIQPGDKVLILGASGAIGSAAVQIAKYFGAEVTGVCGPTRLEYVRALGADHVIDYTRQDFTQNGQTYDLIFDVLGRGSFSKSKSSLTQKGRYLCASFKSKQLFEMLWSSIRGGNRMICAIAPGSKADLLAVKQLIEAGSIKTIVDRIFPMEKASEAHWYAEKGQRQGNIVIAIAQ